MHDLLLFSRVSEYPIFHGKKIMSRKLVQDASNLEDHPLTCKWLIGPWPSQVPNSWGYSPSKWPFHGL